MKSTQQKIYISQIDNDNYFEQKLPTWRDGFCYISRTVYNIRKVDFGFNGHIARRHQENVRVWSLTMDKWEIE